MREPGERAGKLGHGRARLDIGFLGKMQAKKGKRSARSGSSSPRRRWVRDPRKWLVRLEKRITSGRSRGGATTSEPARVPTGKVVSVVERLEPQIGDDLFGRLALAPGRHHTAGEIGTS